jgi:hypothetical protein
MDNATIAAILAKLALTIKYVLHVKQDISLQETVFLFAVLLLT